MSAKLQNFSFLIYTQGIVEETFDVISNMIIIKSNELLSCNFYFEGYFENDQHKQKSGNLKEEIEKSLKLNHVELNSFRLDLYKKK